MNGSTGRILSAGYDDLEIGITIHDPETGAILDVNQRLEDLYGYTRAELLEMSVEEYTAPSTTFTQAESVERIRAAATGDRQLFEWQVQRRNGELLWIRVCLTATTVNGTPCVIAEIRDISEKKAQARRLELVNRVIRHNLRNETNILLGHADRLKAAVDADSLEAEVDTIVDIATEIGTLSDSITQISEIANSSSTKRSETHLNTVVREQVLEVTEEHPAVEVSIDERADLYVNADDGLTYAIHHAVENAVVHNDTDAPSITIELYEENETGYGVIQVLDTGPRIPAVETSILDEQVATTSTYHGSGLGLWIMQWCVASLGGELEFAENEPRGNVVRMVLPQTTRTGTDS